ncbi:MAG: LytTR family DNA-binding domain-containing protein [Bacteroidota bacterium]
MIQAIIIDDEQLAVDTLSWQLREFCPEIEIVGQFINPRLAFEWLQENQVKLCFLDIDMPEMSGFDFLTLWPMPPFEVIFTTAYDAFAIRAFKVSAFDYLLKPIDEEELVRSVQKFQSRQQPSRLVDQLSLLMQNIQPASSQYPDRIALSTLEGIHLVNVAEIVRLEADKNYTTFMFDERAPIVISKSIKEAEQLLSPQQFFRVHQSHTVCLAKIARYQRGTGGSLTMTNADEVPVSRYKKEALLEKLSFPGKA